MLRVSPVTESSSIFRFATLGCVPSPEGSTMNRERPRKRALRPATIVALLVALTVPAVSVDAASAASATTRKATTAKKVATEKKIKSPLPVMNVTDVKTGRQVALASTFDGTKPMLVWFWAPH